MKINDLSGIIGLVDYIYPLVKHRNRGYPAEMRPGFMNGDGRTIAEFYKQMANNFQNPEAQYKLLLDPGTVEFVLEPDPIGTERLRRKVGNGDCLSVWRLRFPSAYDDGYPENKTVECAYIENTEYGGVRFCVFGRMGTKRYAS